MLRKEMLVVRRCEKGHYAPPEGYHLTRVWANEELPPWKKGESLCFPEMNFCVKDGTPITAMPMSPRSKEFRDVFEKDMDLGSLQVQTDWYELYCEKGHRNQVGSYSGNTWYKYCGFCGGPISKTVPHMGYTLSVQRDNVDRAKQCPNCSKPHNCRVFYAGLYYCSQSCATEYLKTHDVVVRVH